MSRQGVIFDLVAAQSPSYRGRGIARYGTDLVRAMVRHHPELVSSVVVHPDLAPTDELADLGAWLTAKPDWSAARVLHMSSVIEPEVPVRSFWPREASANRLLTAVTIYDLIPAIFPDKYLVDPGLRRRWRSCLEVARQADAVLTESISAKSDAVRLLGVDDHRVHVIGGAAAASFRRAEDPERSWQSAAREVKGLRPGFVICVGANDYRKNVDGLVTAYAALPQYLIDRHQLVVVGISQPLQRNHYLVMAEQMGLRGRLLVPSRVSEQALVSLYQCAHLNIFPSLYEGFGFPPVEGMACGAPSIAGRNSSLVEILPDFALFDAEDPAAISEALARGIDDEATRHRLCALTERPPPTWEQVADRAAEVLGAMARRAARRRPAWRSRAYLALVGVPAPLAEALGQLAETDRFNFPGRPSALPDVLDYAAMARLDRWRGGYDAAVFWAGAGGAPDASALLEATLSWGGRAVALAAPPEGGAHEGALEELAASGVSILPTDGHDWHETDWPAVAARAMALAAP